jgi:hypothetical protein
MGRQLAVGLILVVWVLLAACSVYKGPPELQGMPAMINDQGTPRLWVLTKREEGKQVSTGRRSSSSRIDTYFYFDLTAYDPVTVRPLWTQRLLTLGDPEARGSGPSRVIGSASAGRLLGQDGNRVWLLVDERPLALDAATGTVVADSALIEQNNPALKGLMPNDGKYYSFDAGLVVMSADGQLVVVRGEQLQAQPYVAPPQTPPKEWKGQGWKAPLLPIGEIQARLVQVDGQWMGLFSDKEAEDAGEDRWGEHLMFPYSIHNEGEYDEREGPKQRLANLRPVEGAPVYLNGRFLKDLATSEPLLAKDPDGVLVWHNTRIDSEGRLALARLDANLKPVWTSALPLSDSSTMNPVRYHQLPDRLVVLGQLFTQKDGVQSRESHMVSVQLSDGAWQAWNIDTESAVQ